MFERQHRDLALIRELGLADAAQLEDRLAQVEKEIEQLQQLRERMQSALTAWQAMPDGTPDGHTICRLIEHWDNDTPSRPEEDRHHG